MEEQLALVFERSTAEDIPAIFDFYDDAIAFQKKVFKKHWKGFDLTMIENEVAEGRQWKVMKDGIIACIFAVEFSDPLIWGEKDSDPAVYLHRIVSHSQFRGSNFVRHIITWAKAFASEASLKYIRIDTWGDNPLLIAYYVKSGFTHTGFVIPQASPKLPKHYEGIELALFEIPVG